MANKETSDGKPDTADPSAPVGTWSRREFLELVGGYGVWALLSRCGLPPVTEPPEFKPTAPPSLLPTAAPRGDVATPTLTAQPRKPDTGQVFQSPTPKAPKPEPTKQEVKYEVVEAHREDIDTEIEGARIQVNVITDKTITTNRFVEIDEIFLNSHFRSNSGEDASKAVAHLVADAEFRAWQKNGSDKEVAQRSNVSFKRYMQMITECQQGKRDWKDVEFNVTVNDLRVPGYNLEKTSKRPGPVRLVFINPNYTSNMTDGIIKVGNSEGYSYGTEINADGNLEVWVGIVPSEMYLIRYGQSFTARAVYGLARLSWKFGQGAIFGGPEFNNLLDRETKEMWEIVAVDLGGVNNFRTALGVYPNDGTAAYPEDLPEGLIPTPSP